MSSSAQVMQTPVAAPESAYRPDPEAQRPLDEDEVEETAGGVIVTSGLFTREKNSPYTIASEDEATREAAVLFKQVGNGHQLDVERTVERWVQEHTNSSHASPLETSVLKTLLTSFLQEVKVHTRLTEYGTRFLLVLTAGENLCENISDIVNLADLYFRGEYVFFGLSLGCIVSSSFFSF